MNLNENIQSDIIMEIKSPLVQVVKESICNRIHHNIEFREWVLERDMRVNNMEMEAEDNIYSIENLYYNVDGVAVKSIYKKSPRYGFGIFVKLPSNTITKGNTQDGIIYNLYYFIRDCIELLEFWPYERYFKHLLKRYLSTPLRPYNHNLMIFQIIFYPYQGQEFNISPEDAKAIVSRMQYYINLCTEYYNSVDILDSDHMHQIRNMIHEDILHQFKSRQVDV